MCLPPIFCITSLDCHNGVYLCTCWKESCIHPHIECNSLDRIWLRSDVGYCWPLCKLRSSCKQTRDGGYISVYDHVCTCPTVASRQGHQQLPMTCHQSVHIRTYVRMYVCTCSAQILLYVAVVHTYVHCTYNNICAFIEIMSVDINNRKFFVLWNKQATITTLLLV